MGVTLYRWSVMARSTRSADSLADNEYLRRTSALSRQSVKIEKCTWKEPIFVDISSCRDGDETCVISAACLTRRLRWQSDHLLL